MIVTLGPIPKAERVTQLAAGSLQRRRSKWKPETPETQVSSALRSPSLGQNARKLKACKLTERKPWNKDSRSRGLSMELSEAWESKV